MLRLGKKLRFRKKQINLGIIKSSANVGKMHARGVGEGLGEDACLKISHRLAATYPASTTPAHTQGDGEGQEGD